MKTTHSLFARLSSIATFALATFGSQSPTLVANVISLANTQSTVANSTAEYWTPERFKHAQELPLPEPAARFLMQSELDESALPTGEAAVEAEGQRPTVKLAPDRTNRLFAPELSAALTPQLNIAAPLEPVPQDVGTFGAHFSSSRLIPLSADTAYPYRTVGKLFFTVPGQGDFVCSAAVLKPRVILTAGHCVHSGNNTPGFFTNWRFVPAFRDGAAPFQSWNWSFVVVTGTWASGGGSVPNAADYAVIELQDQPINSVVRRIGEITGFLGFQTQSLIPNHAHLLGYPCNLDACQKMHQVTAGSFRAVAPNNAEYGSDMGGGASGGPWVQNFGGPAVGQSGGLNPGMNRVIGVTSYGYISTDPKVLGSSILDSRFIDILNGVCGHRVGNC